MSEEKAKDLLKVLDSKIHRNRVLDSYYDGSKIVDDLGTIVPANFRDMREGLGWCQIAIDSLSERINLFSISAQNRRGGDEADDTLVPFKEWIEDTIEDNEFEGEFEKAIKDFLLYGVTFLMLSKSEGEEGLPENVITVEEPNRVYGNINKKSKLFTDAVRVVSSDLIEYHTSERTYFLHVNDNKEWEEMGYIEHGLGQVPIIPIINRPKSSGWGSSDLSKNARYIFDRAQRMLLRLELSSERYSIPQRYILGVSKDSYEDGVVNRKMLQDHVFMIDDAEPNPDGLSENNRAEIGTLQPSNPENFIKPINNERAEFAMACSIPDSYMGIEKSNPSSADAIRMAESRLIKKAEKRISIIKAGLSRFVRLLAKQYTGELPSSWSPLVVFDAPHTHTEAAAADAVVKLVQTGLLPANHTLTLQRLGYSADEIESIQRHQLASDERAYSALIASSEALDLGELESMDIEGTDGT